MSQTGRLELTFVDAHGAPLADTVDVHLRHTVLSEQRRVEGHDARRPLAITDLRPEPQGRYELRVEASSYWPVQQFVTIPSSGAARETLALPIRPDAARAILPSYRQLDARVRGVLERSSKVQGHEGLSGEALFSALSEEDAAGLLNIARKSLTVPFADGADLLDRVRVLRIQQDRCFVDLPAAVKDQMTDMVTARRFHPVNGSLHDPPDVGFVPAGSFKTPDAFGNLQMTFFECDERCVADIDIDDAAGLGHVFQVVRNKVTGRPTHPFNIHQILVKQGLDPGYRLVPKHPRTA